MESLGERINEARLRKQARQDLLKFHKQWGAFLRTRGMLVAGGMGKVTAEIEAERRFAHYLVRLPEFMQRYRLGEPRMSLGPGGVPDLVPESYEAPEDEEQYPPVPVGPAPDRKKAKALARGEAEEESSGLLSVAEAKKLGWGDPSSVTADQLMWVAQSLMVDVKAKDAPSLATFSLWSWARKAENHGAFWAMYSKVLWAKLETDKEFGRGSGRKIVDLIKRLEKVDSEDQ